MNIKRYNSVTATTVRQIGNCTVNLNGINGTANLTNKACHDLQIKEGDKVELIQDEDRPQDWYLAKTEIGFPVRVNDRASSQFSCKGVIRDVLKSLDLPERVSIKVLISTESVDQEGLTLYPLITRTAKVAGKDS